MYMCMSVLVPTCTVSAAQFFFFFSSRLLNRMREGDEKHRNKNVWPKSTNIRRIFLSAIFGLVIISLRPKFRFARFSVAAAVQAEHLMRPKWVLALGG